MAPPLDLKDLRNLSKRDPTGYHAEFLLQYRHFQTQLQIFLLKPAEDYKPFSDLVEYLCHVSDIYTKDMPDFPQQISNLLEKNCDILASPLRRALVASLILLRSKNQITPHSVLSLFFKLFRCHDAGLREMLYKHIVSDITNINKKHKNQNLNHALQNFMFTMMKDPNEMAAKQSLKVMIELYRKRVWNDAKTVNVISTGVFSGNTNVVVAALKFFLTTAADDEEDRISEEKEKSKLTIKKMNLKLGVRKLGHGARDKIQKAIVDANTQKTTRKLDPNWPAIELINDPQGYTEKVFGVVRHSFERVEVRLMLMNFISRLIFTHKLILLNFYPFVQRYLMPKNEHVTYALSILAQCVHELIPPTDLQPIVKHLVDKFVHDRSSNESIVCGLHTLREMCSRNPLIMTEALVKDLAQYKNYKDKAVTTAARGIIAVFRVHNPALLERKDRGKVGNMNKDKPLEYGEVRAASGVSDIELLQRIKLIEQQEALNGSGKRAAEVDLEGNIIAYESEEEEDEDEDEDGEDDEDGWMEVEDGEDMEDDEESEDEEEVVFTKSMKKSAKTKGGVVPTSGAMSIAQALKLEQMQREAIDAQLKKREKRKRSQDYEEEDEEEEDEDEDEDEESEDDAEVEAAAPAEPEVDVFALIDMAADDSIKEFNTPAPAAKKETAPVATMSIADALKLAQNGKKKAAPKVEQIVVKPRKNAWPPPKKARVEVQVIEESEEEDEEELEEIDSDEWEVIEDGEDMSDDEEEEEEEEEVVEVKKLVQNGNKKKKPVEKKEKKVEQPVVEIGEKVDLSTPIDHTMILTEDDFAKLALLKQMKADGKISLTKLRNMTKDLEEEANSDVDSEDEEGTGFVDPSDLTRGIKAQRKKGEELMKEILEKRANREPRFKEKTRYTTNEENTKRKNLMMIVKGKKAYAKSKMSWRDQQVRGQHGKKKFAKHKHKM